MIVYKSLGFQGEVLGMSELGGEACTLQQNLEFSLKNNREPDPA